MGSPDSESKKAELRAAALLSMRAQAATSLATSQSDSVSVSDERSNGGLSAERASLLEEPGRYASDIQGELVVVSSQGNDGRPGSSKVGCETNGLGIQGEHGASSKSIAEQQPDFTTMLIQYQNHRDFQSEQADGRQFKELASGPHPSSLDDFHGHGARRSAFGIEYPHNQIPLPICSPGNAFSESAEARYAHPFLAWSSAVPQNVPPVGSQSDLSYLHLAIDPYFAPPLHPHPDPFANSDFGRGFSRGPLPHTHCHAHARAHEQCHCHFHPYYPRPPRLPPPPPPPPPPQSPPLIFGPAPICILPHASNVVSTVDIRVFEEGEVADIYAIPSTLDAQPPANAFAQIRYSPALDHQRQPSPSKISLSIETDRRNEPLSDGEVSEHLYSDLQATDSEHQITASLFRKDGQLDVEGIIKSRVESVLKLKDPTLLRNASFRALMLMLKCIKLNSSDAIRPVVDGATQAVVSELSLIAQEFGLAAVADACAQRLSAPAIDTLQAAAKVAASIDQDTSIPSIAPQKEPAVGAEPAKPNGEAFASTDCHPKQADSASASTNVDTRLPQADREASSRASSPGVDMDTSSDAEYEHEFGTPSAQIRRAAPSLTLPFVATPLSMSHFSRSRAPSPPSAQPRTPRRSSFINRQTHIQLDFINQALGDTAMGTPSPVQLPREIQPTPLSKRIVNDSPVLNIEHTICRSENGRLVVYINSSDESSDSDIGYDGDTNGPEAFSRAYDSNRVDPSGHLADELALRRQVRMLNRECRRLALQNSSGSVSRVASSGNLARLNAGANAANALVRPKPDDLSEKSLNGALLEAKMSLKAKEEAIAQLRLEISRKQTKMLLRKKLQEARRLNLSARPSALSKIASAPSSPLSAQAGANAEKEALSASASTAPTPTRELITGDSLVSSSGDQLADSPEVPDVANRLETATPTKQIDSLASKGHELHELSSASTPLPLLAKSSGLPRCDFIEGSISSLAVDKRADCASRYVDILQEAINAKQSELDGLTKPHSLMENQYLDHLRSSAVKISDKLEERLSKVTARRESTLKMLEKLQSELQMTDLELDMLKYAQDANLNFRFSLETSLTAQEPAVAESDSKRQEELRKDIAGIYQRITAIHKIAGISQIVEPAQSPSVPQDAAISSSSSSSLSLSLSSASSSSSSPFETDTPAAVKPASANADMADRENNSDYPLDKADQGTAANKTNQGAGNGGKKRVIEEMRAKMAMMKSQQSEAAKKLGSLLEKRRLDQQQQQKEQSSKQQRGSEDLESPVKKKRRGSSLAVAKLKSFPIDIFLKSITRISKKRADEARLPRLLGLDAIDNCILQPLVVADGIGISGSACPVVQNMLDSSGVHTVEAFRPPVLVKPTAAHLTAPQLSDSAYKSYDSPLGTGCALVGSNVGEQSPDTALFVFDRRQAGDPLTVDDFTIEELNQMSQAYLFEALHMSPANDVNAIKGYYKDMKASLASIRLPGVSTAPVSSIVAAMLPVWAKYRHFGYKKGPLGPKNPLYRVFSMDSTPGPGAGDYQPRLAKASAGAHGSRPSLCRPEQLRRCKAVLEKCAGFPPIINGDLIQIIRSVKRLRPGQQGATRDNGTLRYYDAAASAALELSDADESAESDVGNCSDFSDDDKDSAGGSDMDISTGSVSPAEGAEESAEEDEGHLGSVAITSEELYQMALRILQRGSPFGGKVASMAKLLAFLHARGNIGVGRAIRFLAKALQKYPESEKLWDLYLELYLRQTTDTNEIISVFSDATKFHALSARIWLRYVKWCGWNCMNCKGSPPEIIAWHKRLSMVIATAIKCLIKNTSALLDEPVSAAIAEMIVYSWECSWSLLGQPSALQEIHNASKSSSHWFTRGALVAHMLGCILSKSRDKLLQRISAMPIETSLVSQRDNLIDSNVWSGADWILSKHLLPHHLLFVCQVFVHCFITSDLVPAGVMAGMRDSMRAGARVQSTYFIDLNKLARAGAAETKLLESHVGPVLNKIFGGITGSLIKLKSDNTPTDVDMSVLLRSSELCQASIDRTMAQLSRISPSDDAQLDSMRTQLLVDCAENVGLSGDFDAQRIRSLTLDIAGSSSNFLPLAQLLYSISQCPDKERACYLATCALRDYAYVLGSRLGICGAMGEPQDWHERLVSKKLLGQWIADARAVFYGIMGYTGKARPGSMDALEGGLMSSGAKAVGNSSDSPVGRDHEGSSLQLGSRKHFGTWVIAAFCELLCWHYDVDRDTGRPYAYADSPAADSAQLWLRSGLKYVAADDIGGRAYIWAILLQLMASEQRLSQSDLASMKDDLGDSSDADLDMQCFTAINSVVRSVLRCNPSSDILDAIGLFVSFSARTDVELGARLLTHAAATGNAAFDSDSLTWHLHTRNPFDPLLREM